MDLAFAPSTCQGPGAISQLLRASYAQLLEVDPRWESEQAAWDEYDREVFAHPETAGASLFVIRICGQVAGFGSWDPRPRPAYGIIGHNCILPEFRGRGLGRRQVEEILRRLKALDVRTARVSTADHPFFIPANRMVAACGFREVRRIPWGRDPSVAIIEYEKPLS
jgi:GNAT superfamily N-acetyltransferase